MGNGSAHILDNLLPRPGKLVMRGGLSRFNPTPNPTQWRPCGLFKGEGTPYGTQPTLGGIQVTQRATGGGTVDPWQVARLEPVPAQLGAAAAMYAMNSSGTIALLAPANVDQFPGPFTTSMGLYAYNMGYDSVGGSIAYLHNHKEPKLLAQAVTTIGQAGSLPTVYNNAPRGAVHLASYQQRLWLACGVDTPAGATAMNFNTIFYSNPNISGPFNNLATDWQDPVTGLTNSIPVGDNSITDMIIGFGRLRSALVIFKMRSTWVLRGGTPASYSLTQISGSIGCFDARSIVETDTGVYFIGHRGLCFTDGVRVTETNGALGSSLRAAINTPNAAGTVAGQGITAALADEGQIVVSIGYFGDATPLPVWSGIYNPQGHGWTRVTSNLFDLSINSTTLRLPGWVFNWAPGRLLSFTDTNVIVWHEDGRQSFLRPFSPGITSGKAWTADTADAGATFLPIPAQWGTRFTHTANAAKKNNQLHRLMLDYMLNGAIVGNSVDVNGGWSVALIDQTGADIIPRYRVPKGTAINFNPPGKNPSSWIAHHTQDVFNDTTDSEILVYWDPTLETMGPGYAEIYGVTLEYQATTQRR